MLMKSLVLIAFNKPSAIIVAIVLPSSSPDAAHVDAVCSIHVDDSHSEDEGETWPASGQAYAVRHDRLQTYAGDWGPKIATRAPLAEDLPTCLCGKTACNLEDALRWTHDQQAPLNKKDVNKLSSYNDGEL
jgi:hypothetical protein